MKHSSKDNFKRGNVIAVLSPLRQSGKTTLATSLSAFYSAASFRTSLVDTTIGGDALPFSKDSGKPKAQASDPCLPSIRPEIVSCGQRGERREPLPATIARLIAEGSRVVIDTTAGLSDTVKEAAAESTVNLVIVEAESSAVEEVPGFLAGLPEGRGGGSIVVLNFFDTNLGVCRETRVEVARALEGGSAKLSETVIPRDTVVRRAAEAGEPLPEYSPFSRAAYAIAQIAHEIERLLDSLDPMEKEGKN